MKIATWNVNSLKVRLQHVIDWLTLHQPDVLCLQETKLEDKNFPAKEFLEASYNVAFTGQKTYNGVALLSREPMQDIKMGIPNYADEQKRVIYGTYKNVRIICGYFPNGQSVGSEKYQYKLQWLENLRGWVKTEIEQYPRLALLGDYNIAPEDRDVHDPKAWEGEVLVSEPEREAFRHLISLGLKDSFRLFEQPEKMFSWWDYRMLAFRRNAGLRIDHILLTSPLAEKCISCTIDKAPRKLERPSDHAPVVVELDL